MSDQDALKVLLAGLSIFTETQQLFSDEFWKKMNDFLASGEALCTWNDIQDFSNRLKEFARKEGVQL